MKMLDPPNLWQMGGATGHDSGAEGMLRFHNGWMLLGNRWHQ
jgi:hypothetical protein